MTLNLTVYWVSVDNLTWRFALRVTSRCSRIYLGEKWRNSYKYFVCLLGFFLTFALVQHFALVGSVRVSLKSTMNETSTHFARKTRKSLARQRVVLVCAVSSYHTWLISNWRSLSSLWLFSFLYHSSIMHITRQKHQGWFPKRFLHPLRFLKRIHAEMKRWSGIGRRIPKLNAYIHVRFYIRVHTAINYNKKKKIYVQKIFWELNATFVLVVSLN